MIEIVGLGPGNIDNLTVGAIETVKKGKYIIFETKKHPMAEYFKNMGIKFFDCDHIYEEREDFYEADNEVVNLLIKKHDESNELVYVVPGNPVEGNNSVRQLIDVCKEKNIKYKIYPAVSFVDVLTSKLELDLSDDLRVCNALDIEWTVFDRRVGNIITQICTPFIAAEVKAKLCEYYNDNMEILYCKGIGIGDYESIKRIHLDELDRQEDFDYFTTVFIPKDLNNKKDIYDLLEIVEILRSDEGCPWDKEQTHQSIKKSIIEESYEVLDAINNNNKENIIEELGDVLFQIAFHAIIGKENEEYDFSDIIEGICNKMIYRHPHVFGDISVENSDDVLVNWDELKKSEKDLKSYTDELNSVAKALPALLRANKVQKKAGKVGFDFTNIEDISSKVIEELNEVLDVYKSGNRAMITEEVGDLIFSCVNIARYLSVDPEEALNITTNKFIKRFSHIEEAACNKGIDLKNMTLEEMDELWEEAKSFKSKSL